MAIRGIRTRRRNLMSCNALRQQGRMPRRLPARLFSAPRLRDWRRPPVVPVRKSFSGKDLRRPKAH